MKLVNEILIQEVNRLISKGVYKQEEVCNLLSITKHDLTRCCLLEVGLRYNDYIKYLTKNKQILNLVADAPKGRKQSKQIAIPIITTRKTNLKHFKVSSVRYIVGGIRCGSALEAKYIVDLIEDGKQLPKKGNRIETYLGWYTPDFEFNDRYIEIKCDYTINALQMLKINYINQHPEEFHKPVEIINFTKVT